MHMILRRKKSRSQQVADLAASYLKFQAVKKTSKGAAKGAKKAAKGTAAYQVAKRTPLVKRIPVVAAVVAGVSGVAVVVTKKLRSGDESAPAAA
jgi:hypothetical protein